jgi:methionyl aminopeptidase
MSTLSQARIDEIHRIARSISELMADVGARLAPGLSTREVDRWIREGLDARALQHAMHGFNGFPAASAISIDEQVLHAPPSDRKIAAGSLVTIQTSASTSLGYASHGRTFGVGALDDEKQRLLIVTTDALDRAIAQMRPTQRVGDVSAAIQSHVEGAGFNVVRSYVGYAIGEKNMQEPQLPCYGVQGRGKLLKRGTIFHVHVIATAGTWKLDVEKDEWTSVTQDQRPSALMTAMVMIGRDAPEVLT